MGIDSSKTESKLKINLGTSSKRGVAPVEEKEDSSSLLKKKSSGSGSGVLKFSGGLSGKNTPTGKLPAPAYYPWHALSPTKSESLETDDIDIEAPYANGKPQKFDWISVVFQPLGALAAIVAILVILSVTGSGMSMGLYMLIGGITGVLGIVWGVLRYRSQVKQAEEDRVENEKKYRNYLREKELQRFPRLMEKSLYRHSCLLLQPKYSRYLQLLFRQVH